MAMGTIAFSAGAIVGEDRSHLRRGAMALKDLLQQRHQRTEAYGDSGTLNDLGRRRHLKLRIMIGRGDKTRDSSL